MEFRIIEGSNCQGMHLNVHIQRVSVWAADFRESLSTANNEFPGSVYDGRLFGNSVHVK